MQTAADGRRDRQRSMCGDARTVRLGFFEQAFRIGCSASAFLVAVLGGAALAHDPGLSSAEVRLGNGTVDVELTFARSDLAALPSLGYEFAWFGVAELEAYRADLETIARRALEVALDEARLEPSEAEIDLTDGAEVAFALRFPLRSGQRLFLRSNLIRELAHGHRQLLSIRDRKGGVLVERILDAKENRLEVRLPPSHF